MQLQVFTLTME